MIDERDLTFWPYLDAGALWNGIPVLETTNTPTWQWAPGQQLTIDGDLETLNQLIEAGWERLGSDYWLSGEIDGGRHLRLMGQLADVRLVHLPPKTDYELWARTKDVRHTQDFPVTLAFARHGLTDEDLLRSAIHVSGLRVVPLPLAQVLPPPQFGELALIDHVVDGQAGMIIYKLAILGDAGLDLWLRMGAALKALAAPGEWWPVTPQLQACLQGHHTQLREDLRAKMHDSGGKDRDIWRARMAQLELDRKHAEALKTAWARARRDPDTWLAKWREVREMAAELSELYWLAHQQAIATAETRGAADIEAEDSAVVEEIEDAPALEEAGIIAQMVESNAATMDTTSFAEDRAFRMASLASKKEWTTEANTPKYRASENLAVYFMGTPDQPLSMEELQERLLQVGTRTVVDIRVAMGLWNLRRNDAMLGRNGQALITYNEILHWRGVSKHTRLAHPGTSSEQMVTDGYRTEDRESIRRDFEIASHFYLRGKVNITIKGKAQEAYVDGYYANVTFISVPTLWGKEPAAVWFGPGGWINTHTDAENIFLAEFERRAFSFNPHHEQHELRIALYLTERWRAQANKGRYDDPITMAELLHQSAIEVDKKHLTDRFIPRIESAIAALQEHGVGSFECLTAVEKSKRNWGEEWLAARWRILPPDSIRQSYVDKHITQGARQQSLGRPKSSKGGTASEQ